MKIVYDPMVPQWQAYDKWWKRLAVKLGLKPVPDRTGYRMFRLPDGTIVVHPSCKRMFDETQT